MQAAVLHSSARCMQTQQRVAAHAYIAALTTHRHRNPKSYYMRTGRLLLGKIAFVCRRVSLCSGARRRSCRFYLLPPSTSSPSPPHLDPQVDTICTTLSARSDYCSTLLCNSAHCVIFTVSATPQLLICSFLSRRCAKNFASPQRPQNCAEIAQLAVVWLHVS